MLRKLYLLIIVMSCLHVNAQTNDSVFSATTLFAIILLNADNNQSGYLLKTASEKPCVYIFLSPECPLCKNYAVTLNNLHRQFKDEVRFYGIIPGNAYSSKEIKAFASNYQINFPLLTDSNKILSNYLQASITPQVILLDKKQHLLYKGAIDNWAVSLGKQRLQPTQFYLKDALEKSLQNELITIKRTKAVGCKINDF